MGLPGCIYRATAAGDPHLHCPARGYRAHASLALSRLHVSRIVALVLRPGLAGYEAGAELARNRKVSAQVRCRHTGGHRHRRGLVHMDALAEPHSPCAVMTRMMPLAEYVWLI